MVVQAARVSPLFPLFSPVEHMPCSSWSSARPPCLLGLSPYPHARELARMACPIITQYGKATPPAALLCAAPWTPREVLSERRCQDSRQPCIVCLEQYFSNLFAIVFLPPSVAVPWGDRHAGETSHRISLPGAAVRLEPFSHVFLTRPHLELIHHLGGRKGPLIK